MKNTILTILLSLLAIGCATTHAQTVPVNSNDIINNRVDEVFETVEKKYELQVVVLPDVPNLQLAGGELQAWVNKGDKSPYDGIVLTPEAVSHIIATHLAQKDLYDLTIKKQRESDFEVLKVETGKLLVQLESQQKKSDIRLDNKEKEIKRLQEINKDLSKSKSNILRDIFLVGGGVGVGVIVGIVIMAVAN